MDCQDVRSLLAFTRKGGDQIDPMEWAAVQHHLDGCGDCAAAAHAEELLDAALGTAMRAVAMPAGGRARLLATLAANRPWPWAKLAAAAALLLALGSGGTAWLLQPLPRITDNQIQVLNFDPDKVEEWYRNRGVDMAAWRQLDHTYLWTYDIVEIHGRRVPKLIFCRSVSAGNSEHIAVAQVIVLRADRFNTNDLHDLTGGGGKMSTVVVFVERSSDPNWVYVVSTSEDSLSAFLIQAAN
jgi:hypothetical protein